MKKQSARSASMAAGAVIDAEDSTFFAAMFVDRGDHTQPLVKWATRATAVKARAFDPERGAELFAKQWASDGHVVALSAAEVARVGPYLQFVSIPEGQEVIGQDEQGDYLLVVLEGSLAVDRVQPWGGRARLAETRPGDILGEMSLLDGGARFSACTTLTPSVLAVLDAQHLDAMVSAEPRLALALVASLARRLSLRLRQVSTRLSALLSGG